MKINRIILFLIIITSITVLYADNKNLILKKISSNFFDDQIDEYSIKSGDLILIKCKNKIFPEPKFIGGNFIEIKNNYIFFETNNILLDIKYLKKININNIELIYTGNNVRTWTDLRNKWTLYLSLIIIPGSIEMAKTPGRTEGVSVEFAALVNWSFFSLLSHITYAPLIASIDFNKRKKKATKFIIGTNDWIID